MRRTGVSTKPPRGCGMKLGNTVDDRNWVLEYDT